MSTARVVGRDALEQLFERERQCAGAVVELFHTRTGELAVELVHRIGRAQHEDLVAVFDVGIDQELDGFVGAIGERELIDGYAEVTGEIFERIVVFGVDAEIGGSEIAFYEIDDVRRAPTVFSLKSRRSLLRRPPVGG